MPDTSTTSDWELRSASYDPHLVTDDGENEKPLTPYLHWALSFGFAINLGHLDGTDDSPLLFDAHFCDTDQARGFVRREVTAEQLVSFARLVLDVVEPHLAPQSAQQVAR